MENKIRDFVKSILDKKINEVFIETHWFASTSSGDISPDQQLELDRLTKKLEDLIVIQTMQNL